MRKTGWKVAEIPEHIIRDEIYLPVTPENLHAIAARGYKRDRRPIDGKPSIDIISPKECREIVDFIISQSNLMDALAEKCSDIGMAIIDKNEGWDIHIGLETWLKTFAYTYFLIARDFADEYESDLFKNWKQHIQSRLLGGNHD